MQTKQRKAIFEVLKDIERPLMPQEILFLAKEIVPNLGIATVYRTLKIMLDTNEVNLVRLSDDSPRYELAVKDEHNHHHHFSCTSCHKVFQVQACPNDLEKIAPSGFLVQKHELSLYGLCKDCK